MASKNERTEDSRRRAAREAKRVVVKLGTAVITTAEGYLDLDQVDAIVHQIAQVCGSREV